VSRALIPKINKRGSSFKGIASYLLYGDLDNVNAARVSWSMTGNLYTNDIETAAKVMAWTVNHSDDLKRISGGSFSGRKSSGKPVYHHSLSWAIGEEPDEAHQKEAALSYIDHMGLSGYEYFIVGHNDTDHVHLHIVANLVHQDTGITKELGLDKRRAQEWALDYERENGIHCEQREINASKREGGEYVKHQDTKQDYSELVTRCYESSDSGVCFVHALEEEGLYLGRARRGSGFVIVDSNGGVQKLARQLDIDQKGKAKSRAINDKLGSLDVPDGDELSAQLKSGANIEPVAEDISAAFEDVSHAEIEAAFFVREAFDRENLLKRLDAQYSDQERLLKEELEVISPIATAIGLRRTWYKALNMYDKRFTRYQEIKRLERKIIRERRRALELFKSRQLRKLVALKVSFKEPALFSSLRSSFEAQQPPQEQARHE